MTDDLPKLTILENKKEGKLMVLAKFDDTNLIFQRIYERGPRGSSITTTGETLSPLKDCIELYRKEGYRRVYQRRKR